MPQTFRTSHLTLDDIQDHNVSAEDLVELCIELGEEYGTLGFTTYVPESSVTSSIQPKLFVPASPLSRARLEHTILHGLDEADRSAREKAIRSLAQHKLPPYEEAIELMEQRWETMQNSTSESSVSEETLNEWKQGDLYEKVIIWYQHKYPPPKDDRDVEVLLNDGHSGELKTVRLYATDSIEHVLTVFQLLSQTRNDKDELVDSGTGDWMFQLMNARKKSVTSRRKLVTDRDYRNMIREIKGKNTKTPYAVVVQESTPLRMKRGPPAGKLLSKPVNGVDVPGDVVLEDGTVLTADIDWDAYCEKEFGKAGG